VKPNEGKKPLVYGKLGLGPMRPNSSKKGKGPKRGPLTSSWPGGEKRKKCMHVSGTKTAAHTGGHRKKGCGSKPWKLGREQHKKKK